MARAAEDDYGTVEEDSTITFQLMELPMELRLQIYGWLHLMSPVRHPQLAPWYPSPRHSAYVVKPVVPTIDQACTREEKQLERNVREGSEVVDEWEFTDVEIIDGIEPALLAMENKTDSELLSPFRPLSALPSALLRANNQIYYESRTIPFEENEFVFVNWFASGLWAASIFTKRLEPWQSAHLRYVRLEMRYQDFLGPGLQSWEALCSDWADGVHGLRMKLAIGGASEKQEQDMVSGAEMAERNREMLKYIGNGLGRVSRLEQLELELATDDMEDLEKVR